MDQCVTKKHDDINIKSRKKVCDIINSGSEKSTYNLSLLVG